MKIGDLVHYVAEGGAHRPALVVDVNDEEWILIYRITTPEENGIAMQWCGHDESAIVDTWHYPEIT